MVHTDTIIQYVYIIVSIFKYKLRSSSSNSRVASDHCIIIFMFVWGIFFGLWNFVSNDIFYFLNYQ